MQSAITHPMVIRTIQQSSGDIIECKRRGGVVVDSWRCWGDLIGYSTYQIFAIKIIHGVYGIWVYMEQQTYVIGEVKIQVLQYQIGGEDG